MNYQLKIQIRGITKPPVWRRVIIPAEYTFHQLHCVIQEAFGWEYEHLYQFQEKPYDRGWQIKEKIEDIDSMFDFMSADVLDSEQTKVGEFLRDKGLKKFVYIYDFGDDWFHDITIEDITEETAIYPRCINGKGACPPEDCGGVMGYEEMKYILKEEPHSEDAENYHDWLGLDENEEFNPKAFDLNEINENLIYMAKHFVKGDKP